MTMQKYILMQLLRNMDLDKKAKKKIAIGLGVGALLFTLLGGLALWGAYRGTVYVAQNLTTAVAPLAAVDSWDATPVEGSLLKPGCLDRVQWLLSARVWLEEPVGKLKVACLQPQAPGACSAPDCANEASNKEEWAI